MVQVCDNLIIKRCWVFLDGIQVIPEMKDDSRSPESFWHVLDRDDNTNGYALKINDVIKLGRVMFKINQVREPFPNFFFWYFHFR